MIDLVTPESLLRHAIDPALIFLSMQSSVPVSDEARVMVLAIAGQESDWGARLQYGGPARSFWQFEAGGGVAGVLNHPASADKIKAFCKALIIPSDQATVFEAMAWNGYLGAAMARLLLWTDPQALPELGDVQGGWDTYNRNWRPGAPHPDQWPAKYQKALSIVQAHPVGAAVEGADV